MHERMPSARMSAEYRCGYDDAQQVNSSRTYDEGSRVKTARESTTAATFVQLCASQNDLFALDEDGDVYQYNFNTKTWLKLAGRPGPVASTS